MGSANSTAKDTIVTTEEYDPCKSFGCALQSCFYQQINKRKHGGVIDEDPCFGARLRLEQCRRSHFLNPQSSMNPYFDENNQVIDEYQSLVQDNTGARK